MHKENFRVIKQKGFYKLINGDCLEVMKGIPDKSIDCIVCDPPYGTTACKWDSIIPFDLMWEQLERIIKDDGAIVLFGSEPFSTELRHSNIKMYKDDWVWNKVRGVGHLLAKKRPMMCTENISVFYKKQPNYNPQMRTREKRRRSMNNGNDKVQHGNGKKFVGEILEKEYPINEVTLSKSDMIQNNFHPTQKPVDLLSYLIKTYSNEGETVLDFTMGSGSTGVACMETGRKFIGIELDEQYFKISCGRVKQALEYKNDYGDW